MQDFFKDDQGWRSETVLALCRAMRETHDYSAVFALADALEEADFPYKAITVVLRQPDIPGWMAERLVACVFSPQTAQAVFEIDRYASELGPGDYPTLQDAMTYERLMAAAKRYVETGDDGLGGGSMDWSNTSMDGNKPFWANYRLVTNTKGPDSGDEFEFLSCRC